MLADYIHRRVPEYYNGMHRDGYSPHEIKYAHSRMMQKEFLDPKETEPAVIIPNIIFKSEVKIKWVMTTKKRTRRSARRNSSPWWRRSSYRWWKRVWKLPWTQLCRNCSKTGSKKRRKPAWPNLISLLEVQWSGLPPFFVFYRGTAFSLIAPRTATKIVFRNENHSS